MLVGNKVEPLLHWPQSITLTRVWFGAFLLQVDLVEKDPSARQVYYDVGAPPVRTSLVCTFRAST
eukprot:4394231-Amphidinium_carterae.2